MATWQQVETALRSVEGAEQLSETMWMCNVPTGESRRQKVFVSFEKLEPFFELVRLSSAFTMLSMVDPEALITEFGGTMIGSISYTPHCNDDGTVVDGIVGLSTTVPLMLLDVSDTPLERGQPARVWFGVFINTLGQAADRLEQRIVSGFPDMF